MKEVTWNDYYEMKYVGMPDYCQNARAVCYTLTTPDPRDYAQSVVLQYMDTDEHIVITAGGKHETCPKFSPKTTAEKVVLAFLSDVHGEKQIFLYDSSKKETTQITDILGGVSQYVFSPNGQRIAFLAPNISKKQAGRTEFDPIVIEDYGYRSDACKGFRDTKKDSLAVWVVSCTDGKAECLTQGSADYAMPVWYPNSEDLMIAGNQNRPRSESIGMDLYRICITTKEMTQLTKDLWIAWYPKSFEPLISKDGSFAILGALNPKALSRGNLEVRLYRMDLDSCEITDLWPEQAPCHEATCFLYNGENYGGFGSCASLGKNDTVVYFISGWHGEANVYEADVTKPYIQKASWSNNFSRKGTFRYIGQSQNGNVLVARGDFSQTAQLYLVNENTGEHLKLTDTDNWRKGKNFSIPEELWCNTLDGKGKIQGFVMEPHNREKNKTYPAVLYIHGGPTPFYGFALTYEFQFLAAAGIGVIFCNPRGSSGYGEEHGQMKYAFDQTAMYDLLQFTREAVKTFDWIDGDRLGVTGGSYGGYMTNWIAGHTKCFRAAVTQRSIANELIQYASSDMAGSSKDYESFTDFMKEKIRQSPVAYADQIDIPFLILHGIQDMRCPVEQAHELFVAVKDTHPDLPVRLVLFPGANHELTMEGSMELRIEHYRQMVEWFQTYL